MSGDLDMSVTEADGSVYSFVMPYSTLPTFYFLRSSNMKSRQIDMMVDSPIVSVNQIFALGTLIYGLPEDITLYGGGLLSECCNALKLDMGISLGGVGSLVTRCNVVECQGLGLIP